MQPWLILQLLILLAAANGAPLLAKKLLGERFAHPLDGGVRLADGHPLFGRSKTIRGVVFAIAMTTAVGPLIGLGWQIGALVGILAMVGDLFSSFLKRRMGLAPSSRATGIDQVPEALFPLLACRQLLPLTAIDITAGVFVFFVGEILLSRLLYRLRLRDRPY